MLDEQRKTDIAPVEHTTSKAPRMRDADMTLSRFWIRYRFAIVTILNLTAFAVLWEVVARAGVFPNLVFPTFVETMNTFKIGWIGGGNLEGFNNRMLADFVIASNFWESIKLFAVGVGISLVVGIPVGLMMGGSKWFEALLNPYVWTLSSVPRIAIYPILVMILGFGYQIKLAVVILTAIFPVVINTWAGVKTTDQSMINAAKVFGASKADVYRKVVLPYTLPFVITGVQLSLSRGLIGVVLAEFLSGAQQNGGIGWLIFRAAAVFNSPLAYASLISLAIFALVLVQGTRSLESRIAPWRQQTQT